MFSNRDALRRSQTSPLISDLPQMQGIDDALKELEIDGYKVKFSMRVTLLPVDLIPPQILDSEEPMS